MGKEPSTVYPTHEIELDQYDALDPDLLVPPSKRTFGEEPDIEAGRLRLRIGERPIARNLRDLYQLSNRNVPPDYEVFMSYDLWLLTHSVSVVKEGGFKRIRKLGYQMRFADKPRVTVLDIFPQTRFVTKIAGLFNSEFNIQINGQASVPDTLTQLLDYVEDLSFGGSLTLTNNLNVVARIAFSVMTPTIMSVGCGDNASEWVFEKDKQPLVGDQLMVQIVLTPKRLRKLNFKARVYATVSSFNLVPARYQSEWINLECALK